MSISFQYLIWTQLFCNQTKSVLFVDITPVDVQIHSCCQAHQPAFRLDVVYTRFNIFIGISNTDASFTSLRGGLRFILDWDIKWFDLNLFHLFTPTHTYIIHFHLCCRCQETGYQRSHVDIIRRINIYSFKNCICSECRTGGLWIVELNTQAFSSWLQHSWHFQWAGFSHGPSSPAGRVRIGPGSPTGRVGCGPGSLVFLILPPQKQ